MILRGQLAGAAQFVGSAVNGDQAEVDVGQLVRPGGMGQYARSPIADVYVGRRERPAADGRRRVVDRQAPIAKADAAGAGEHEPIVEVNRPVGCGRNASLAGNRVAYRADAAEALAGRQVERRAGGVGQSLRSVTAEGGRRIEPRRDDQQRIGGHAQRRGAKFFQVPPERSTMPPALIETG